MQISKTLTVRLDEPFHRRPQTTPLADRTNFQAKVQAMLEEYVDGPAGPVRGNRSSGGDSPGGHAPLCFRHA